MEFHIEFRQLFPYGNLSKDEEKIARKAWQAAINLVRYGPSAVKKVPAVFTKFNRKESDMNMRQRKQRVQRQPVALTQSEVQFMRVVLRQLLNLGYEQEVVNNAELRMLYNLSTPETQEGKIAFSALNHGRKIVEKNKQNLRKLEAIQRKLGKMQ